MKKITLIIFIIFIVAFIIIYNLSHTCQSFILGGNINEMKFNNIIDIPILNEQNNNYSEIYQRPSKQVSLDNKYSLQWFINQRGKKIKFKQKEDVVYAYYGILMEASNMDGYKGGCGSVGDGDIPYSYAYQLLTKEAQKHMSLNQFKDSFKGIGHITLLKILPININIYMIEIEVIRGSKNNNEQSLKQTTSFSYYYGTVNLQKEDNNWKIKSIDYFQEDFLCAPYHGWSYNAQAVLKLVYIENLKLIDKIIDTQEKDGFISIFATGNGKKYRFDFVRLTNGYEILIGEKVFDNNEWIDVDLLPEKWQHLKLR
jgi:hypothetical protein